MGLYRPTVTKRRPDGEKFQIKTGKWWGSFRHPVTGTLVRVPLGTGDKSAAQTLLRAAERRAALEHAGLVSPFEEHHKRPLGKHVNDFKSQLRNRGGTDKHVKLVSLRVRRIVTEQGLGTWADLSASAVTSYIGKLRDQGVGAQTRNFYLQAIKQFARWMVADRRVGENPLAHIKCENVRVDRRHDRRALSGEELRWLLQTTRAGQGRFGISGSDRALVYWLVAETGLRVREVRSLTPRSFVLDNEAPYVVIAAAYSKRRREDVQPLRPDLALVIKERLKGLDSEVPVFAIPERTAKMIREDLEDARAAWIKEARNDKERARREKSGTLAYRAADGLVADFHALRHTFLTNLCRGGVHPKLMQQLARHSTITLTMDRYTHADGEGRAEALRSLPNLARSWAQSPSLPTANDTNSREKPTRGVCTGFARAGDPERHATASLDTAMPRSSKLRKLRKQREFVPFVAAPHRVASSNTRAATVAQLAEQRFCKPQVVGSNPTGGCVQ